MKRTLSITLDDDEKTVEAIMDAPFSTIELLGIASWLEFQSTEMVATNHDAAQDRIKVDTAAPGESGGK